MGLVGADIDQLHELGDDLRSKQVDIDHIISTVRSALAEHRLAGSGPRAPGGRLALRRSSRRSDAMKEAFDSAGTECKSRATQPAVVDDLRPDRPPSPPGGPNRPEHGAARPCSGRFRPPAPTIRAVQELEFTVEPFVEGRPGPHVTAAVDAARAAGATVEFGPVGSTLPGRRRRDAGLVAAITGRLRQRRHARHPPPRRRPGGGGR